MPSGKIDLVRVPKTTFSKLPRRGEDYTEAELYTTP